MIDGLSNMGGAVVSLLFALIGLIPCLLWLGWVIVKSVRSRRCGANGKGRRTEHTT